jgi:hypothetical protein
LIGESFDELNLRRSEGTYLDAARDQCPNKFALLTQGTSQEGAKVLDGTERGKFGLRADVGNVEGAMLAHPAIFSLIDADLDVDDRYRTKMSARNHHLVLAEPQLHVVDPANPSGALDDGVENWLHVGG